MSERPTLLLLPGLLCDATVWEPAEARLSPHFPVAVGDFSTQDSLTAMAEDTLAAHAGPLCVAGHSMGGRVAMEMVRIAPERVRRLALLDTGTDARQPGEEARRRVLVDLAYAEGMTALARRWLPPLVHERWRGDEALMGRLTRMVERRTPELHERQIRALLGRPDASRYLPEVTCPTLVLVGRQDTLGTVAQHEEIARLLPRSRLVVIEEAGHFAPVEQPEAVAEALAAWALD